MSNKRLSSTTDAFRYLPFLALIGTLIQPACALADNQTDTPQVDVGTSPMQRGLIGQPIRAYGVVAAAAANMTAINLSYVARITRLLVQNGQTVKRGQPLFVAQADPSAALALTQAQSAAVLATGERKRTQALMNQGLATASQLATAQKAEDDASQALALERRTGVRIGDNTIVAPADGVVLQVAVGQGDQVQAGTTIVQLNIASTDGEASHGVARGSAAMSANDRSQDHAGAPRRGNVSLGIEPTDAPLLKAGDALTLHGLASALTQQTLHGRVVFVGAAIDPQSQLVPVGADVPVSGTAFIPGTHVVADIATRIGMHWIAPRDAVLRDTNSAYLFQITPDHKAHRVNVTIAVEDGDRYGVDGAIDPSRPLVVRGNYELTEGMAVHVGGDAAP